MYVATGTDFPLQTQTITDGFASCVRRLFEAGFESCVEAHGATPVHPTTGFEFPRQAKSLVVTRDHVPVKYA